MNTGRIIYQKLRLVYKNKFNPDGTRKPYLDADGNEIIKRNSIVDPDYVPPVTDGCTCPALDVPCDDVPPGSSTTTSTTTPPPVVCDDILSFTLDCSGISTNILTLYVKPGVVNLEIIEIVKDGSVVQTFNNLQPVLNLVTIPIPKSLQGIITIRLTQGSCIKTYPYSVECPQTTSTTSTSTTSTTSSTTTPPPTTITSTTTLPPTPGSTTTPQQPSVDFTLDPGVCSLPDDGITIELEVPAGVCDVEITTTTLPPTTTLSTTTVPTTSTSSTTSTTSSTTTVACSKSGYYFAGKLVGASAGSPLTPYTTMANAIAGRCAGTGTAVDAYLFPTISLGAKVYQNTTPGDCNTFPAGYYYIQNSVGEPTVYAVQLNSSGEIIAINGDPCGTITTTSGCKSGGLDVTFRGKPGTSVGFDSMGEANLADCNGTASSIFQGVVVGPIAVGSKVYANRLSESCEYLSSGYYFLQDAGGARMNIVINVDNSGNITAVTVTTCTSSTSTSTSTSTTSSTTVNPNPCESGISIQWRGQAGTGAKFASKADAQTAACNLGTTTGCEGTVSSLTPGNSIYTRFLAGICSGPCYALNSDSGTGNGWYWVYPTGNIDNSYLVQINDSGVIVSVEPHSCGVSSTTTGDPAVPTLCSIIAVRDNEMFDYYEGDITFMRNTQTGAVTYIGAAIIGDKYYGRITGSAHVDEFNLTGGGFTFVTRRNNVLYNEVTGLFSAIGSNILYIKHEAGQSAEAYLVNPNTWVKTAISGSGLTFSSSVITYNAIELENGILIGYAQGAQTKVRLIDKTTYVTIHEVILKDSFNSPFDRAFYLFTEDDKLFLLGNNGDVFEFDLNDQIIVWKFQLPTNQANWPYQYWYSVAHKKGCGDNITFPES